MLDIRKYIGALHPVLLINIYQRWKQQRVNENGSLVDYGTNWQNIYHSSMFILRQHLVQVVAVRQYSSNAGIRILYDF